MPIAFVYMCGLIVSATVAGILYAFIHHMQHDRTAKECVYELYVTFTGMLFTLLVQCVVFRVLLVASSAVYPPYAAWADTVALLLFCGLSGYTFSRYIRHYGWRTFVFDLPARPSGPRQQTTPAALRPTAVFLVSGWVPLCLYFVCTQAPVSISTALVVLFIYGSLVHVCTYAHASALV